MSRRVNDRPCPTCHVDPGEPCRTITGRVRRQMHVARREHAKASA